MSNKMLAIITLSMLCVNAFCVDMDKLVDLQGDEYVKVRDEILKSLNVDAEELKASADDSLQIEMLKKILLARIKHPELFDKLTLVIEKARNNSVYIQPCSDFENSDTGYTIISGDVSNFMSQGIEKKEYKTTEYPGEGRICDRTEKLITQTDEQVSKAIELNRAARMAVIEKLWKLSTDYRVIYELVDIFNRFDSDNKNKDLVSFVKEIFNTSEYDRTIKTCCLFLERYTHKDFLPELRKSLKKFYKKKNYKCCFIIISTMENIIRNENEDLRMIDEMLPELEVMKEAEIAKNEKTWDIKMKKDEDDKRKMLETKSN